MRIAALVNAMGLEPIDMGPLYVARYLEGLARLRMTYKAKHPDAFECFFRLHRDDAHQR
jgi:predicted dinucleotide-binding enzyme